MAETLLRFDEVTKTGIREIDAEHEAIVRCVNELHAGMLARVGREALNERLEALVTCTEAHFRTEEALMREHGYPDYTKHKLEHEKLIAHVVDLEHQLRRGDTLVSFAIALDLKNWASIHIDRSDQPLGEFLRARGVE
jgi:hemerythrin-like metal-binding protein